LSKCEVRNSRKVVLLKRKTGLNPKLQDLTVPRRYLTCVGDSFVSLNNTFYKLNKKRTVRVKCSLRLCQCFVGAEFLYGPFCNGSLQLDHFCVVCNVVFFEHICNLYKQVLLVTQTGILNTQSPFHCCACEMSSPPSVVVNRIY